MVKTFFFKASRFTLLNLKSLNYILMILVLRNNGWCYILCLDIRAFPQRAINLPTV